MKLFYQTFALFYLLWIPNVISFTFRFICPKDGRWPHPHDCEKYYTCNGSVAAESWCGHGMTYDIDHERCDLSKNIDCKHGERPNWHPPEGWFTASVTERPLNTRTTTTTTTISMNIVPTEILSSEETTLTTMFSTRLAQSRLLLFSSGTNLIENHQCRFEGNLADADDCQSYFTCQNGWIIRQHCPDKYLFDDDLHTCNDYRKVFCGNRPSHEHGNNPCLRQPNGWYAEANNQCRTYYLCTEQRITKTGECPEGSRWNGHRLRCDDPRYLPPPCGSRQNHGNPILGRRQSGSPALQLIIFGLFSFILFIV